MRWKIRSVLVIDDQEEICETVCDMLESFGIHAHPVIDDSLPNHDVSQYDLIILDWYLANTDGLEMLEQFKNHEGGSNIVLMTGAEDFVVNAAEALIEGYGHNHCGTLRKPFQKRDIENLLDAMAA